jgi:hypothetical protein
MTTGVENIMLNKLKIDYDLDINEMSVNDELGFIDIKLPIISVLELKPDMTDDEVLKLMKNVVNDPETYNRVVRAYKNEVESMTDVVLNNPFTFKHISVDDAFNNYGIKLSGKCPVSEFKEIDDSTSKIVGEVHLFSFENIGEMKKFLDETSPFVYSAKSNEAGEYILRLFTSGDHIISSRKYTMNNNTKV